MSWEAVCITTGCEWSARGLDSEEDAELMAERHAEMSIGHVAIVRQDTEEVARFQRLPTPE